MCGLPALQETYEKQNNNFIDCCDNSAALCPTDKHGGLNVACPRGLYSPASENRSY